MVAGRALYQRIADASSANARQLVRDAERLASAGSRGHASSLAILSIEESAKAIVYYLAAQGVYRIVKKKPNYVTTYRKGTYSTIGTNTLSFLTFSMKRSSMLPSTQASHDFDGKPSH